MPNSILQGTTQTVNLIVTEANTAHGIASEMDKSDFQDQYVPVFSTTSMIGLMELASGRILESLHGDGQLSVGAHIDVRHLAPSPIGAHIQVKSTFIEQIGPLYHFQVEAWDDAGKIGEGHHTRAIIDLDRMLKSAQKRIDNL